MAPRKSAWAASNPNLQHVDTRSCAMPSLMACNRYKLVNCTSVNWMLLMVFSCWCAQMRVEMGQVLRRGMTALVLCVWSDGSAQHIHDHAMESMPECGGMACLPSTTARIACRICHPQ